MTRRGAYKFMQMSRKMLPIIAVVAACATVNAQQGWYSPAADSPDLIVGYMRFHVALADAINRDPLSHSLSAAPRETLGISLADFKTLANEYRAILEGSGKAASP